MSRWLYTFGGEAADPTPGARSTPAGLKTRLGAKGAALAEMARLGLPVPPGFILTTELCAATQAAGAPPEDLDAALAAGLAHLAAATGRELGASGDPLMLSVRTGAAEAMPGLAESVLNLGLTDTTAADLAAATGDARFAYDSYRRFIQLYGDVVLGLGGDGFEDLLQDYKDTRGVVLDSELTAADWRAVVARFSEYVATESGQPLPQDPNEQLRAAVLAMIASWRSPRARVHRRLHGLSEAAGTAVIVQAMVFGNRGPSSATGIALSRDPTTGAPGLTGDYLMNAQGEDVVGGVRLPQALTRTAEAAGLAGPALETTLPEAFATLDAACRTLERHYRDLMEVEFTVETGRLWLLEARPARRAMAAALKLAVDLVAKRVASREEALAALDPIGLEQLLHPTLDPLAERDVVASGLPASPGAAAGIAVFSAAEAMAAKQAGRAAILVRVETSPDDIQGILASAGVVTARGGMTSHAAVVARGMGKPCISGAGAIRIDAEAGTLTVRGRVVRRGQTLTVDGTTGTVMLGAVAMRAAELSGDFATVMAWADAIRRLGVRANADTPADARVARAFGAEGIGLVRTEHMFFDPARVMAVRGMILAGDGPGRRRALETLLPMQRDDFATLFEIMAGRPVTVRLLDPPLHEFLPREESEIVATAAALGVPLERVRQRLDDLAEFNPMLGHRGVRLAVSHPEIIEMQARALFEAAADRINAGAPPEVEIMVPLVAYRSELDFVGGRVAAVAAAVAAERGIALPYRLGTMIELPRAALRAGDLAESAAFFSFGTNDLTQTTLGLSRDDAAKFLPAYVKAGLMQHDPFATLDRDGVGDLIQVAIARGRAVRPELKLGLCGEHGGDPASIRFAAEAGLDYVSCSPYRVPIARLAAAQAAIAAGRLDDGDIAEGRGD